MHVLNFSHPLTQAQINQVSQMVGRPVDAVSDVKVHFDLNEPFFPQIAALVDCLAIDPANWQVGTWLIVLPSLNYIAGVLLAELHGRIGHFPAILRLKPVSGTLVTEFEVAEIINLESVRQRARSQR